jgi:predicted metal-dependent hydrolase
VERQGRPGRARELIEILTSLRGGISISSRAESSRQARIIETGLALARARRFHEAHDAFEEAWRSATGPRRELLQALVHAATALTHLERGNAVGARLQQAKAARRVDRAGDDTLAPLARAWIDAIGALLASDRVDPVLPVP